MAAPTMSELEKLAGKHTTQRASEVKASWRGTVAAANAFGQVIVTNYNRPEVVVISIDEYARLKSDAISNDPLKTLRAEFDRELAVLREPKTPARLREAFASTPRRVARVAKARATRRKKK